MALTDSWTLIALVRRAVAGMALTNSWTIIALSFEQKRRPDGGGLLWRAMRAVTARSVIHGSLRDGGRL